MMDLKKRCREDTRPRVGKTIEMKADSNEYSKNDCKIDCMLFISEMHVNNPGFKNNYYKNFTTGKEHR